MKGYALTIALALVLGGLLLAHLTKPKPPPTTSAKPNVLLEIVKQNGGCADKPTNLKQG